MWYEGNDRTITTANEYTSCYTSFFDHLLCYSKKYAGIPTADTAIPVNLAP